VPTLIITTRSGEVHRIEGPENTSVMSIIRDAGIDEIVALCGGCLSCATCHVFVDCDQLELLTPMSDDEDDLLEGSAYRSENSRLSCQINMNAALDNLKVRVAPEE